MYSSNAKQVYTTLYESALEKVAGQYVVAPAQPTTEQNGHKNGTSSQR